MPKLKDEAPAGDDTAGADPTAEAPKAASVRQAGVELAEPEPEVDATPRTDDEAADPDAATRHHGYVDTEPKAAVTVTSTGRPVDLSTGEATE